MWNENEDEYVSYLESERKAYAWVLVKYGDYAEQEAIQLANDFYQYEPLGTSHRGLVFHDQAWHWAMKLVYGDMYWVENPELESPSDEYEAL